MVDQFAGAVAALKAVWIDLDVGPDKGYPTVEAALEALKNACVRHPLPTPSAIVFSGGGLHVYWINDTPMTVGEWSQYSEGLRAAGVAQGLKADWQCTIDSVRVLRIPGTLNHKFDPPRLVKILVGRFNAAIAEACAVFLDEALWAGDRKGEQILKALVTEDTFQLERKFCDPIPVKNHLRIMIASNNQWIVPVGTRGRRYCVLDVSNQYADESDPAHAAYWEPLQAQFGDYAPDDGRAAMLYDLLLMDLSGFNVRAVPESAAKTEQKLLTQKGTEAWLFEILQDGAVTMSSHGSRDAVSKWDANGMQISLENAYEAFLQFSQTRREYQPRSKEWWSRDLRKIMKECVSDGRPRAHNPDRQRYFTFRGLLECRAAYSEFVHADDIEWEPVDEIDAGSKDTDAKPDADAEG